MQNLSDQYRSNTLGVWLPVFCFSFLFLVIFYSAYINLFQKWSHEDYNYCYLILPVTLYLLWEKRIAFLKEPSSPSWHGIYLIIVGLILFWLGELGGEFFSQYLSSWLIFSGLLWICCGWKKLKTILFPVFFVLTMFPPPDFIYFNLSLRLKLISSRLGVWALQSMGKSAYREGNVIDLGFTQLQVVDACNGLRYLFPLIVLAILVAYLYRSSWWKKIIVVLSAIPISIFVNGLRIASVGLLYPIWGSKVAEGFFHDFSGWAIFMISLGILLAEQWLLSRLFPEKKEVVNKIQPPKSEFNGTPQDKTRKLTKIRLFHPQMITAMILLASTAGIAQTVNFREAVPISRPFSEFPLAIGSWQGHPQTMEQIYIDELDLTDYIIVDYRCDRNLPINFYTAYYESQRKGESIHSPSSCLPGSGWEFNQAGEIRIPLSKPHRQSLPVNRAVMTNVGQRQLSYFWFPMRGRVATNMWEMKLFNFWDALTRQRTDGALVRLITPIGKSEKIEDADARLQAFTRDLVPVLNQFLPQ